MRDEAFLHQHGDLMEGGSMDCSLAESLAGREYVGVEVVTLVARRDGELIISRPV